MFCVRGFVPILYESALGCVLLCLVFVSITGENIFALGDCSMISPPKRKSTITAL